MCAYDQRVRGNLEKLLSPKRICLSAGGGDPTIQPMRIGSLSIASRYCVVSCALFATLSILSASACPSGERSEPPLQPSEVRPASRRSRPRAKRALSYSSAMAETVEFPSNGQARPVIS